MTVEVLVAAMHQTDHSLPRRMNLQSNAIVGNQCEENSVEEFEYNGHTVSYYNSDKRGLSKNRNTALIYATGDICLLADDDMVYKDGYVEVVEKVFAETPEADVIIFNIEEPVPTRAITKRKTKVSYFNYLRFGSVRIAFKLDKIRENAIFFNQCFGAGTERGFGEDNLFLTACLKNKLSVYAVPESIAVLTEERESTWFRGYDAAYLHNKGLLFRAISKRWSWFLCLQDALRHHKRYGLSAIQAYTCMRK